MCRNCGRVRYTVSNLTSDMEDYYRTTEYVEVVYSGSQVIRIDGCASGMKYLFAPGVLKLIDVNDAECIVALEGFDYAEVESDKSESPDDGGDD